MPDIKVPAFPESIEQGQVLSWRKSKGESFARDELLVEIETDKVVMEVPAPSAGVLTEIKIKEGETVTANQVIGSYEAGKGAKESKEAGETKESKESSEAKETKEAREVKETTSPTQKKTNSEPAAPAPAAAAASTSDASDAGREKAPVKSGPAARRLARETGMDISSVKVGNRPVTKQDLVASLGASAETVSAERKQERVPMSRLRASIAKRLVQSQQTAAMLTTFNEVNMRPVMELRAAHKKEFESKHGARLGFMSFFVRACVYGLRRFPEVNAYIEGEEIVYHNYNDIGIAVSSPRGLVVPVLRDAHVMDLAAVEKQIAEFGEKAKNAKLSLDELQGGTFTISNGGVFGSLMSTPIINPPQTAILGMHKIQERPVAKDGEVQILPMMYLALSYDHRMIDGKTAVQFLVAIKEFLEYPGLELLGL